MSKPDILERLLERLAAATWITIDDVDDAADEIKKLRCEVALLHRRVHVAESLRMTDAEREALTWSESAAANAQHPAESVLRSLRERHAKGGGA